MSKPTKEIIALSKKLHELGYRQEINTYDVVVLPGCDEAITITKIYGDSAETTLGLDIVLKMAIPIPSIEDGLLWLSKLGIGFNLRPTWDIDARVSGGCIISWELAFKDEEYPTDCTVSHTPREAVFKAMVAVFKAMVKVLEQ